MEHLSWRDFEKTWADNLVDSVNAVRELNGLTVGELGERLRQVGWPVGDATLRGILSGRKRGAFTIAETCAFARALNVSPTYLITGLPAKTLMPELESLWGKQSFDVTEMAAWMRGYHRPPTIGNPDPTHVTDFDMEAVAYYSNASRVAKTQAAILVASEAYTDAELESVDFARSTTRERLGIGFQRLVEFHDEQEARGEWRVELPSLPGPIERVRASILDMPREEVAGSFSRADLLDVAGAESYDRVRSMLQRELGKRKYQDGAPTDSAE